jgi:ketosteroid isomerase-like protein
MVDMAALQGWLDSYVGAWRTYDPGQIEKLFSQDAVYTYHPFDQDPVRGRDAILKAWLENPDQPGSWEGQYRALAVTGDIGVAQGWTRYRASATAPAREYRNMFVIRFDGDGRCREFTEWYMEPRRPPSPS